MLALPWAVPAAAPGEQHKDVQGQGHSLAPVELNSMGTEEYKAKVNDCQWCGLGESGGNSQIEEQQCGVVWYLHVEKAGGTTIKEHLEQFVEPNSDWKIANVWDDTCAGDDYDGPICDGDEYDFRWNASKGWNQLQRALREDEKPKVLVHWHFRSPGTAFMLQNYIPQIACELEKKGCELNMVTHLREPNSHTISKHGFNGIPHKDFVMAAQVHSNFQSKYVLRNDPSHWIPSFWNNENKDEDYLFGPAEKVLSKFALVGRMEQLGDFMGSLDKLLGVFKPGVSNKTVVSNPSFLGYKLSEKEWSEVEHHNNIDRNLYTSFCASEGKQCEQRERQKMCGQHVEFHKGIVTNWKVKPEQYSR